MAKAQGSLSSAVRAVEGVPHNSHHGFDSIEKAGAHQEHPLPISPNTGASNPIGVLAKAGVSERGNRFDAPAHPEQEDATPVSSKTGEDVKSPDRTSSSVPSQVERYVIFFPLHGEYLAQYHAETGVIPTTELALARLFRDFEIAINCAAMFGGEVRRVVVGVDGVPRAALLLRAPAVKPRVIEPSNNMELMLSFVVESAGAVYVGIQKSFEHNGKVHPALVLFNSKLSGSTLAIALDKVGTDSIREIVLQSDSQFGATS